MVVQLFLLVNIRDFNSANDFNSSNRYSCFLYSFVGAVRRYHYFCINNTVIILLTVIFEAK